MEEPNDDAGRQQLGSSCRTRRQGERLGPTATQCWGAVQGTRVQLRPSALNALGQRARQPAAEWELGGDRSVAVAAYQALFAKLNALRREGVTG